MRRNDKECKEREESTRKHGLKIMGRVRFHALFTIHAMKPGLPSRYHRTETFPVVETTNLTSISSLPTPEHEVDKPAKTSSKNKKSGAEEIFLGGEGMKKPFFLGKKRVFSV